MNEYETDVKYIRRDLDRIIDKLDNNYVTKGEFAPVQKIVYGLVGLILTSVMVGLLTLIFKL